MLLRIDHVGIVVDDLAEASKFLEGLGMHRDRTLEVPGRLKANFYTCGQVQIEVLEITDSAERSARLGTERARIEHIAIEVDSLASTLSQFAKLGVRTQTASPVKLDKGLNFWTVPETCDGVVYQLIEPV